jgi:putative endonuclease
MACFLYILKCADGSYYTGTYRGDNLDTRISEHNKAHYENAYTTTHRPVELMFAEEFANITDAIAAERKIKGWSRAKKEAMVEGRWTDFPWLARRVSETYKCCILRDEAMRLIRIRIVVLSP